MQFKGHTKSLTHSKCCWCYRGIAGKNIWCFSLVFLQKVDTINAYSNIIHSGPKEEQPTCPFPDKQIDLMLSIHTIEKYLAVNFNEVLTPVTE